MIKGPEFFVRFVNYTFGDGFLLMAPTVALIMMIIILMIAVWAATALYCRCTQKKRARTLMKTVKGEREDEIRRLRAENEEQRKEIRRIQYEVIKWRKTAEVELLVIRRVHEVIHNPAKARPDVKEKK